MCGRSLRGKTEPSSSGSAGGPSQQSSQPTKMEPDGERKVHAGIRSVGLSLLAMRRLRVSEQGCRLDRGKSVRG